MAGMTTLTQHGVAWRFNGWPITDDEGEIIGEYVTPKWAEADLTPDHWNELAEWFAQDRLAFDEARHLPLIPDIEIVYGLLERNGVEHEHVRGTPLVERRPAYGFTCAMCKGMIVAKDPGDFPFYGGPLDGRWLVTDGRRYFYAPVPVAITVTAEAPTTSDLVMPVATYERRGDRYVAI